MADFIVVVLVGCLILTWATRLATFLSVPIAAFAVVIGMSFIGNRVCRFGSGLCTDNIIPGPLFGAALFMMAHLGASATTFLVARMGSLRTATQIAVGSTVGLLTAAALTAGLLRSEPDRLANVAVFAGGALAWFVVFVGECLINARGRIARLSGPGA